MKRIAVLGSPGSGKTTLSARLGELLDLPVVHLDELFWTTWGKGSDPSPTQIREKLEEVAQPPRWIIDGIHGGQASVNARRLRLEAADTIIYLDTLPLLCVVRLVRRRLLLILQRPKERLRPHEKLTWGIIRAAWTFRRRRLKEEALEYAAVKRVIILPDPQSTANFLESYATQSKSQYRQH